MKIIDCMLWPGICWVNCFVKICSNKKGVLVGGVAECTGGIGFRSSRIWAMAMAMAMVMVAMAMVMVAMAMVMVVMVMAMGVAGMAIIGVENGCGKLGQYMKEI
jgi:hypothetical protein